MLKLVELRLEMELFPLVERGTFFLRKLDPISTSPSPLDPLFQRLPQLLGTHVQKRFQGVLAPLNFFFFCDYSTNICS
jgi:hypothetical protein